MQLGEAWTKKSEFLLFIFLFHFLFDDDVKKEKKYPCARTRTMFWEQN